MPDVAALTPAEASVLLSEAVDIVVALDEAERKPGSAVPRAILTSGRALVLASALVHLIVERFPELVDHEVGPLVAATHFRSRH